MPEDALDLVAPEIERGVLQPYEGMFGDTVAARVLQEVVADPFRKLRPGQLAPIVEASPARVRAALDHLASIGLLNPAKDSPSRKAYVANPVSKRMRALAFLADGILDDLHGTAFMERSLRLYLGTASPVVLYSTQIQVNNVHQEVQVYTDPSADPSVYQTEPSRFPVGASK